MRTREPAAATTDRLYRMGALLLFLAVLVVFGPLSRAEFLNYDDPIFIAENRRLDGGFTWENLRWALTANLLFFSPALEYWSPLTALSRLLDVTLWGKEPWGHHSMSILLHGLSAVTLLAAVRRLTGHTAAALAVATVFALHPVLVEPVAWLSARKDVVYGLTWNLTLLVYAGYARQPMRRRYLAFLATFLLAAMSKPMALTLPCVLLLLDIWPLDRIRLGSVGEFLRTLWGPLLEKLPLFAVSSLLAWAAMFSQRGWNAVVPEEVFSLSGRVGNSVMGYSEYLHIIFWPSGYSPFHPFQRGDTTWWLTGAVLLLAVISGLALWQLRKRPWLAVGWFWFLGVIFPVSGIVQIGASRIAERYLYVALPGLALALVWQAVELARARPALLRPLLALGAVLTLAMAVISMQRAVTWQTSEGVWAEARRLYPDSKRTTIMQANAAYDAGHYAVAGPLFGRVLAGDPRDPGALVGVARLTRDTGQLPQAAAFLRQALELKPDITIAYLELAEILAEQGQDEEALAILQPLCQRVPYMPEAWLLMARVQYRLGQREAALASMEQCWKHLPLVTATK